MLTFVTLLLGIVSGPHTIEVGVGEGVAFVELRLDEELVATIRQPPWQAVVDFGAAPAPHHLDAIARNAHGREIARARQRVNFPRPAAEATLTLLPGTGGTGRAARLTWESMTAMPPEKVTASFDGKPLATSDPERIELPPFVPERLHFLRAAVDFPTDVSATTEITFGGRTRERTEKELTAFPVRAPGGRLPAPEAMDGWFLADGEPLHVVAVEEGEPSTVFVLDADGSYAFRRMREAWMLPDATGTLRGTVRTLLAYPEARAARRTFYEIFPGAFPRSKGAALIAVLASVRAQKDGQPCPRLADAVAVAALAAAEHSHPRAVVLVLTGNPDVSFRPAREIRDFLSDLGVPLVVWTAGPAAPDATVDWGESRAVHTRAAFREAVNSLEAALDEQRIVWVEGAHLPQSIFSSPKAPAGVVLVR
ncbi:MAG: hypothetical protein ACHQM4_06610 [Thermoanaerobaculia bacterium]